MNKYLIYILVFISVMVSAYFLYNEYVNTIKLLETTRNELTIVRAENNSINKKIDEQNKKFEKLSVERSVVIKNYQNVITELNKFKNREDIVTKKPGLVQLKINKSFDTFQQDLSCISGNDDLCPKLP